MGLLKRFGYYFIGLALGAIAVTFFWKQKKVSFDYGMDARTLKTIRIKEKIYSQEALRSLQENSLDTVAINSILKHGDVNFGKSEQRLKPCGKFWVEGVYNEKSIDLWIVRCDSTSTIERITVRN